MTFLAKELLVVTLVHLIPRCEASCQREFALRSKESVMGTRHIKNVARNIIGKLGIVYHELIFSEVDIWARKLWERHSEAIRREISRMSAETQGKIAAQGLGKHDPRTDRRPQPSGVTLEGATSLYAVHHKDYLHRNDSGREILIELATTAIIAEMTDILREASHRDAERMEDTSEGM